VAAENEEGLQQKKTGEEKIDFGAGEDEGDDAAADGTQDGAGFDGKINFGCGGGTDANSFLGI